MNVKDFLIGACTAIVGAAIGVAICCCVSNCGKKCDKQSACPTEQVQQCCPQGECCPDGPCCQKGECCPDGSCCQKGSKQACERRKPHGRCPMEMAKELNLSEEQMTQVKALFDAQKSEMKAAREKFDEAFKAILTDEQKAKFAEMKAKKKCPKDKKCEKPDNDDDED